MVVKRIDFGGRVAYRPPSLERGQKAALLVLRSSLEAGREARGSARAAISVNSCKEAGRASPSRNEPGGTRE
jgi:hypothetical protein